MKIIQQRDTTFETYYQRVFWYEGHEGGWGFGFDCDEDGNVDVDKLHEIGRTNYQACQEGEVNGRKVIDGGVQKDERKIVTPRIGKCECGSEIYLDNFTNTCECGVDYNSSGHRLAPREQWGEETGEHWSECY